MEKKKQVKCRKKIFVINMIDKSEYFKYLKSVYGEKRDLMVIRVEKVDGKFFQRKCKWVNNFVKMFSFISS